MQGAKTNKQRIKINIGRETSYKINLFKIGDVISKEPLILLRLFIGITFIFAGSQKLANPNFFNPKSSSSITAQMIAYSRTSPIGGVLKHLIGHAQLIGLIIALGELAVGIGILLGLLTKIAALGGMLISLNLFLSVSFNTNPYYTGSDIVFFFAFTPFLLSAPSEFSIDKAISNRINQRIKKEKLSPQLATTLQRRILLKTAAYIGALGGFFGTLVASLGRIFYTAPKSQVGFLNTEKSKLPQSSTTSTSGTNAPMPPTTSPGYLIGQASQLPVGQAATFTDPVSGDPAYIYRPSSGQFLAFDAICPHAGCTVSPSVSQGLAICPCHGSEFDLKTGAVISGPAQSGLSPINVKYDPANGNLYVTD